MLEKVKKHIKNGTLRDILHETRWIYSHMRPYRKALFFYILLGLAATALSLITALISKELINAITPQDGDRIHGMHVARLGISAVLLAVSSVFLTGFTDRFSTKINQSTGCRKKHDGYGNHPCQVGAFFHTCRKYPKK